MFPISSFSLPKPEIDLLTMPPLYSINPVAPYSPAGSNTDTTLFGTQSSLQSGPILTGQSYHIFFS